MHLNRYLFALIVTAMSLVITSGIALAVEESGDAASQNQSLGIGVLLFGVIAVVAIAAVMMGRMGNDES